MTCKDCLHYGAHKHFFKSDDYEKDFDDYFKDKNVERKCPYFTDRSEWVHLPCKAGDTVYQTDGVRIYESDIYEVDILRKSIIYNTNGIAFDETAIGKSIFLTREKAEEALKERAKNEI